MSTSIVSRFQGKWSKSLSLMKSHPQQDLIDSTLKPGKVLIAVQSCGLCFPNVLVIEGKHAMKKSYPHVPTDEVSGTVLAVAENVKTLKKGDKVFGVCETGGLSEKAVCDASRLYKVDATGNEAKDENLLSTLAGFEVNYGTTYHALVDIAHAKAGEVVLVLGASGGVGMSCIDIAKVLGCKVIACASTEEKLAACKAQGADVLINYTKGNLKDSLKEVKMYGKVDIVYDAVGGAMSEPALRSLGFGGRFLVVGFASGGDNPKSGIPSVPLNLALLNERQILGVFWGPWTTMTKGIPNRKNMETMVSWVKEGKLQPTIYKTFDFSNYQQAFEELMGRQVIGKVLIKPSVSSSL